jgi:cardiolipin synthase
MAASCHHLYPRGVVERTDEQAGAGRVLTVPNLLSVLRLAGVPLFLWLLLGPHEDVWAIVVLALGGISDWADGKLARLLNQYSRLGELLDPAADRLYILAALLGLGLRGVVPWWAIGVLVGRDAVLAVCLPLLRRRGYRPPPVVYLGKAATFLLLWTFPLLLAGLQTGWFADLCRPTGYASAIWGSALYLYTGALYLAQVVLALRTPRASGPEQAG